MQRLILVAGLAFAASAAAQTPMLLPAYGSTFTSSLTRGFWFTVPVNCIITGVLVPNEQSQPNQVVEIIDLGGAAPPAFPGTVTGTQLFYDNTAAGGTLIPTTITLTPGQVIGVLGACNPSLGSATSHNSYGTPSGPFLSDILGNPVTLTRFGTQSGIASNGGNQPCWQESAGPIGRVELNITPAAGLFANFSGDVLAGSAPHTVNFTDNSFSSATGGIIAWLWDFDNDGTIDSTAQNPTHTYAACGLYDVKLEVVDGVNPNAIEIKTAYIEVDPLVADFTASPTGGFNPLIVNFTDTSSNATSWAWDFDNDGTIDSTVQHPTTAYATGQYSVSLTVSNACNSSTETKINYITVIQPGVIPPGPEILNYQFNEVRGTDVANTASTSVLPSSGTVTNAGWHADPNNALFRGNEPGFGSLGNTGGVTNQNLVSTGVGLAHTGDMSITWRQRMQTAPGNALAYAFGGGGASWRCFTGGVAGTSLWYRGTPIGDIQASYNVQANPGVWEHIAISIDDQNGVANWYVNGVLDTTTAFTAGTHAFTNTNVAVGFHTSTTSTYTTGYDMDDFRIYSRALTQPEITVLSVAAEHASAGAAGTFCTNAVSGDPLIAGTGGLPTEGNAGFGIEGSNLENGQIAGFVLDLFPAAAPVFNLDPFLGGPGCELQMGNLGVIIAVPTTGTIAMSVPIPAAGFEGWHIYAQCAQLGSAGGSITKVLDINIQK